jgi:outer membrane protein OmpA-like peptidoglycan-associated protein
MIKLNFTILISCGIWANVAAQKLSINVENEKLINSVKLDFSPTYYKDGIIFVSNNSSEKVEKVVDKHIQEKAMSLFIANKDENGVWEAPKPFGPELASLMHEGPLTFDKSFKKVYFSRNHTTKRGEGQFVDLVDRMQIYEATLDGKSWTNIKILDFVDDDRDYCHPSLTPDGQRLYFASNRKGGQGGMDLYFVDKTPKGWTKPVNLGPSINSREDEVFPFIHENGSLYFSSDKGGGEGGLDLYIAEKRGNTFEYPLSMGSPFNSSKDDFGLIIDSAVKSGYFSSDRQGGKGQDDIYSFTMKELVPPPPVELFQSVNIVVFDKATDKEVPFSNISIGCDGPNPQTAFITDENGKSILKMKANMDCLINVMKQDYEPQLVTYTKNDSRKEIYVFLERPKKPEPMVIIHKPAFEIYDNRNIYYDYDKDFIRSDARLTLDSLITILKQDLDMKVELVAHTDSRGKNSYNAQLASRRSINAEQYLLDKGIDKSRIIRVSEGELHLINECGDNIPCPEEKHQLNRRTEIRIIKYNNE